MKKTAYKMTTLACLVGFLTACGSSSNHSSETQPDVPQTTQPEQESSKLLEKAKADLQQAQSKVQQTTAALQTQNKQLQSAQNSLNTTQKQLTSLKQSIAAENSKLQQASAQLVAAEKKVAAETAKLKGLETELKELQSLAALGNPETVKKQLADKQAALTAAQSSLSKVQGEANSQKQALTNLQSSVKAAEQALAKAEAAEKTAITQLNSEKAKVTAAEKSLKAEQAKLETLRKSIPNTQEVAVEQTDPELNAIGIKWRNISSLDANIAPYKYHIKHDLAAYQQSYINNAGGTDYKRKEVEDLDFATGKIDPQQIQTQKILALDNKTEVADVNFVNQRYSTYFRVDVKPEYQGRYQTYGNGYITRNDMPVIGEYVKSNQTAVYHGYALSKGGKSGDLTLTADFGQAEVSGVITNRAVSINYGKDVETRDLVLLKAPIESNGLNTLTFRGDIKYEGTTTRLDSSRYEGRFAGKDAEEVVGYLRNAKEDIDVEVFGGVRK